MFLTKIEYEEALKKHNAKLAARDKATAAIRDAKARYIKSKTRARSKKAALEKDAILSSARFAPLDDYETRDDIHEAYGWGYITESMYIRLEDLWDEREELKRKSVGGVYADDVTELLSQAEAYVSAAYDDELEKFADMERDWKKEEEKFEEERIRLHNEKVRMRYC